MAYYFFRILGILLILNLAYKSYIYYTYEKVEAKVIGYDGSEYENYQNFEDYFDGRSPLFKSPLVEFKWDNYLYQSCRDEWKYLNFLRKGHSTIVLIDKSSRSMELATFSQFWLTYYNVLTFFTIAYFGTVFVALSLPERIGKKPREWK